MWHPIEKAPVDEFVLLADSGGYVSQAIYGEDEENPRWRLANGQYLHTNFVPLGWMPMPEYSGSPKKQSLAEDIFRCALLDIKSAHVPDQPASSQADETTWVMQHVGSIRRIASKALDEASQLYSSCREAITDEEIKMRYRFTHHALVDLYKLCKTLGNFKNGVVHNGIDEGEVYASGVFDRVEAVLRYGHPVLGD